MSELDIDQVTNQWRVIMEDSSRLQGMLADEKFEDFLKLTENRLNKLESFFDIFDTTEFPATLMETIISDIEKIRIEDSHAMDVFNRDQAELAKLFTSIQTGKKGIKQYQGG